MKKVVKILIFFSNNFFLNGLLTNTLKVSVSISQLLNSHWKGNG